MKSIRDIRASLIAEQIHLRARKLKLSELAESNGIHAEGRKLIGLEISDTGLALRCVTNAIETLDDVIARGVSPFMGDPR